jgi:outer membrane protein assembly factor BamB
VIGGAACLAAACFPGIASAQISIFPPPGDPTPSLGPSSTIFAPEGASTASGGNPSQSGEITDPRVFGPLEVDWHRRFAGQPLQPLVVDGVVIVNSTGRNGRSGSAALTALSASTGKVLWRSSSPGAGSFGEIATSDGVIVVVDHAGTVRGLRVGDGSLLWQQSLGQLSEDAVESGVVADAGSAYVYANRQVYALNLADGALRWTARAPLEAPAGAPAVDSDRVFVVGECGDAAALSRASGALIWMTEGSATTCFGAGSLVGGGRLVSTGGQIFDAVTGARLGSTEFIPAGVSGDLIFGLTGPLTAYNAATGELAWKSARFTGADVPPRIVGPTTYGLQSEDFGPALLSGVATNTGKPLSKTEIHEIGDDKAGGLALSAGGGHVIVANGDDVIGLGPRLKPPSTGVDLLFPEARDYYSGSRFHWIAGVGAGIRQDAPEVQLEANEAGNGQWATVDERRTLVDGEVVLHSNLDRNTRFRARVSDAELSSSVKLFAYPRFDFKVRRTSDRIGEFEIRISGVDAKTLEGRKSYAYLGRGAERTFIRLGSARIHVGRGGVGVSSVRFRLLKDVGRHDLVSVCAAGLPEAGYGRDIGLAGHCGASRVPYPPRKHDRSLPRAPSTACARLAPAVRSRIATSSVACAEPAAR